MVSADEGQVIVSGSHGGVYSASFAVSLRPTGIVLHNAGVGLAHAGVAGLDLLDDYRIPAAAVDHDTARIGNAEDVYARGVISHANRAAQDIGVSLGDSCRRACERLLRHQSSQWRTTGKLHEASGSIEIEDGTSILIRDSASLLCSTDTGGIVVTGSHGGLIASDPSRAIKVAVRFVAFNDAGVGVDEAGIQRLPALDRRSIAAVTVSHLSAKIGDAQSSWDTGIISYANRTAAQFGATPGQHLQTYLRELAFSRALTTTSGNSSHDR
jgi:hypothetical protein